jgi:cation diffusion facilitator family transporter
LWNVLFANLAVAAIKITLGLLTGALAVLADGFHSLVDSSSNLIGLAAIRLADRPADARHPYGYRRYETIGALAIGVMLLAAAWEIGRSIVTRIGTGDVPAVTPLTLGVFALTLPINVAIFILETRAGRRLKSEVLLADAVHTRTDLVVASSVIASLIGIVLGVFWLDLVVAAGVVVLILMAAFGILRDTASWLTDVVIADPDEIESIALQVPGVLYVHRIRSRGTPEAGFVDLHVKVHPGMSTSQAHAIATEVENRLRDKLPQVIDALVHIEPGRHDLASDWEQIAYDLRQVADGMGLGLHDLHVHAEDSGGYAIELHLEMPGDISLGDAHSLAEKFEKRVGELWPSAGSVITHLEPIPASVLASAEDLDGNLPDALQHFLVQNIGAENLLEMKIHRVGDHNSVAARIRLPMDLSLVEAHNRAEEIERSILTEFPELMRVTVHVEP